MNSSNQKNIVVVGKQKSVGVAFLLAFFFGPLGLLYASVTGGIVMFLLGIIVGIVTLGLGLIFVWIGCIIWAVIAANSANKNIVNGLNIIASSDSIPSTQPSEQTPFQERTIKTPKSTVEKKPRQTPTSSTMVSQFDLYEWFGRNKKSVLFGLVTIMGILILIVGIKFVLSLDFSQDSTVNSQPVDNSFKETSATTTYVKREIPIPKVPIVKAANVWPNWIQNEEVEGDYILIGLYVGAIGIKPIKISIVGVDTTNNHVVGFSIVNNNRVDFEGSYKVRLRKASTNQASNVIDFDTYVFNLTLFEPDGVNKNGVFQLQFEVTDAQGRSGSGSWTSYNGNLYREISVKDTYLAQEQ